MTHAIIQARLGSRRFPGKALADLEGHPLIWHVCTRVQAVSGLASVNLVCPESDLAAFQQAVPPGVGVYPLQTTPVRWHQDGSVAAWDVLGAFAALAKHLRCRHDDILLRVTGDCPAFDPEAGALTIDALRSSMESYLPFAASESPYSGWPDGAGCEAFCSRELLDCAIMATWPADREHPTRWMYRHLVPLIVENPHGDLGHLTLSVNTPEDLTVVREYLRQGSDAKGG